VELNKAPAIAQRDRRALTRTLSRKREREANERCAARRVISEAGKVSSGQVPMATVKLHGGEPLCFGDFHLGQQMKGTRQPGRNPASFK
jgi:hypothetical protein